MQIRRMACAVHARCQLLGAERAGPEEPARHGLADLRRPRLLETRVRRLASPRIYSQEPRSRTTRIIANVTIEEQSDDARACVVRSKFQLLEYRRDAQTAYGGTLFHRLVATD